MNIFPLSLQFPGPEIQQISSDRYLIPSKGQLGAELSPNNDFFTKKFSTLPQKEDGGKNWRLTAAMKQRYTAVLRHVTSIENRSVVHTNTLV